MAELLEHHSALHEVTLTSGRLRLKTILLRNALLAAVAVGLGFLSFHADAQISYAQTANPNTAASSQPTGAETEQGLQEVIVTGSYIPRTDTETPSPVTVISNVDIQASGYTSSGDVIRNLLSADNSGTLPTDFPGAFASGASGVALRGLTVNSTLVLIDGLRVADYALPDDGVRSFVDLNSIPVGTIDHIETLQDGASSVYGADAIAGVVNIILKKTVQGFNANAEIGDSQHGGGFEKHLDFSYGFGDLDNDKHNFYIAVEYNLDNAIGAWERPYPYNDGGFNGNFVPYGGINLNQSPDFFTGSIYGSVTPGTLSTPGNVTTGVPLSGATSIPLQPCPASAPRTVSPLGTGNIYCDQNQTWYDEDAPPTERVGVSTRYTVKLNDTTQMYLEAVYYQNESDFNSGPPTQIEQGFPNVTTAIALPALIPVHAGGSCPGTTPTPGCVLNPNNPFAAAGDAALINYAFGDLGPEITYVKNHSMRLVADLAGLEAGWNYDLSAVIHHTWLDYELGGFVDYTQLISDVTNGTYNFVDPAANSPAVRTALAPRWVEPDSTDMDTVVARVNRPLFDLPGGPLAVALGAEWRYESEYDGNFNINDEVQGFATEQAIGQREIASAMTEFDAPLLKSLELNVSGRFDHYSDFGNATTPKIGLKFKPIDLVALRGTFSRGFRAPSFAENGNSEVEGFIPYGVCPSNLCTAHGADGYVTSYTLGELTTGNKNIKPERSTSYTAGIVLSPLKQFTATFDYYYIKKTELIAGANPAPALDQYETDYTLPPGFTAAYDVADPAHPLAPPRIITIASPYINGPGEYTDGVDIDLRVNFRGPYGTITSDLSATKILAFVYEQGGGLPNLEYVGLQSPYNLSSGAGTPQYRANWINTWIDGPFTTSVIVHYVSGYKQYGQDVEPYVCLTDVVGEGFTPPDCRVGSFTDIDLMTQYNITPGLAVSFGIDNVADIPPPVDASNYAGNDYNPTYTQAGIVGRFFRLGLHYKM
jgi:iron complex outermembrane recepter protein